jgi:hypothetical protein
MSSQTRQTQIFNHILLQVIDNVLTSIGGTTKNIIYLYLKNKKGISIDEIPLRFSEFHEVLESVVGAKGVLLIEEGILELLEARIGVKCVVKLTGASTVECVVFLHQQFINAEPIISNT